MATTLPEGPVIHSPPAVSLHWNVFVCKMHTLCIVCLQGPLPNTCGHFWEMVWEQKSRGVVMLNRVMEKGSVSHRLIDHRERLITVSRAWKLRAKEGRGKRCGQRAGKSYQPEQGRNL